MRSFAFFALLLLSANVLAQTPAEQIAKLQKDPNIIWIGEFYRDYEDLDNGYEGRNIDRYRPDTLTDGSILHAHCQNTSILKLERRTPAANWRMWQHYLWAQIIDPKTKIFADADLSQPISDKDRKNYVICGKDTIDTFDPETFAIIKAVLENELNPNDIYGYRLRQLVYYNAKENMYYNLPLSIAPIMILIDNNGNRIGTKILFWLPVIASSAPINPSKADNMPFIKSVRMELPFADAKVLKESKKSEAVNLIWRKFIIAEKDKIFATAANAETDDENNKALLPIEINNIFFTPDTIEVFDTNTSAYFLKPIVRDINTDIVALRINQTFGWDDQKKTLTISTYSIAPIINSYDYNKNLLNSYPHFYLYPHRRFKIAK